MKDLEQFKISKYLLPHLIAWSKRMDATWLKSQEILCSPLFHLTNVYILAFRNTSNLK